jgi:UDP-N-acetylmuramoyl-L-alanyl-D-glutamate--2,6-diaminopimelate ligase
MRLLEIIKELPFQIDPHYDFEVQGVTDNSREVKENFIFVAIKGHAVDGNDYVLDAINRGAKLIISTRNYDFQGSIQVSHPKEILGILLRRFYAVKPNNIVAVTGTNGKSSVVHFYKSIFELLHYKSASIGTLGVQGKEVKLLEIEGQITTPSLYEMHRILYNLKSAEIDYVALEASSHGLEQGRLLEIDLKAAAFTSFASDHLDYHETRDNYFMAKLKLFTHLLRPNSIVVINNDMEEKYLSILYEVCAQRKLQVIKYGKKEDSDLKILNIDKTGTNQKLTLQYQNVLYKTEVNLIGEFQVYNILAAIGLALGVGGKIESILEVIPQLAAAEGRMKEVRHSQLKGKVYIDYAHTADALEYILKDLRQYTTNKLKLLFGCGGNKDPNRRSAMGKAAAKWADEVFITDDNPRDEDPAKIRQQIIEFCPQAIEIPDRKEAIRIAVASLDQGDILVITGKGHENYHIVKGVKSFFSDQDEVLSSVNDLLY